MLNWSFTSNHVDGIQWQTKNLKGKSRLLTSYNAHQPYLRDAAEHPAAPPPPPQNVLGNLKHFPSCRGLQREIKMEISIFEFVQTNLLNAKRCPLAINIDFFVGGRRESSNYIVKFIIKYYRKFPAFFALSRRPPRALMAKWFIKHGRAEANENVEHNKNNNKLKRNTERSGRGQSERELLWLFTTIQK